MKDILPIRMLSILWLLVLCLASSRTASARPRSARKRWPRSSDRRGRAGNALFSSFPHVEILPRDACFRGQRTAPRERPSLYVLCVFCVLALACCLPILAQEVLWSYAPPAGSVDTSPGIGDINGDGQPEIVLATTAGVIVTIDAQAKEVWRKEIRGPICFPPTVADVTGDPAPEVLVMNRQGQIVCMKGATGDVIWNANAPGQFQWGTTALAAGDVDGDGALEIVAGTEDGAVICLRGSGEQSWITQTPCRGVLCPAIADVNGDGKAEVLVGGEEVPLMCLSSEGKELWRLPNGIGGSPFVYDLDQQGPPEILTGVDDKFLALDGTGKVLWSTPMHREMDSALAIADANGDGEVEIYVADLSGYFMSLSPKGQIRWDASVEERARRSPSIGDVDGDGANEILVAGYSGAVHVFDPEGGLKARVPLPGTSNSTATLAVLGTAGLCAVVPTVNEAVQALHWPDAKPDAQVLWPEFRYDSRRTGTISDASTRTAVSLSVDWGSMYVGSNCVKAVVANPQKQNLTVRIEVTRANAAPVVAVVESAEERIEHQAWYVVPGSEAANLSFACTVSEGPRVLARRSRTAFLTPFVKELSDADATLREIEKRSHKLIDAKGVEDRAVFLSAKLDGLRNRVSVAGALEEADQILLRDSLAKILDEAQSLLKVSDAAEEAAAVGSTIRVCAANPWAPFGGFGELAEGRFSASELSIEAFGGETESAAMNVFNLSSVPRAFRIELDALKQGDQTARAADALTLSEVIDVPTEMRDLSSDALPQLNPANILQIPAWGARQLWIGVNTRSLPPGDWTGNIRLRSLDVEPLEVAAPLKIRVWNARVPEKQILRNCGWGYVHSSVLKDIPEAALQDQISHGTNVFVGTFAPKAQFDAEGNLVGDLDFREHDDYVKRHTPHGIILFCGYQGALQGPASTDTDIYGKAHVQWLRAWVAHLAELGVGYDGFALYPVDEPGLSDGLVTLYLRMAKLAREADPKILMYTDPVERITEDELREMLPYVDIWCPNRTGLVINKITAPKLDIIKNSGRTIWMYECAANVKHQSPLAYYRAQAWLSWEHGFTGIGFWSYCTSQDDPWFLPLLRHEYLLIYPGNNVVSSKRWEAVRDGVEDYGLLASLREALNTKGAAASPEDVAAAQRLLTEQASSIAAFCDMYTDETDPDNQGLAGVRKIEDKRWAQIQEIRRELARLLDALNR